MDLARLRAQRLRSHRLTAPAATVRDAAAHMLAVQAQEFWGGRWALASRTRSAPRLSDLDAAFDAGDLVRAWTMRGTIHIIPPRELAWVLSLTAERQFRQGAAVRRAEGIDEAVLQRAERLARAALRGGGRLDRRGFCDMFEAGGVSTAGQRGYHLIVALALRGVVCWGPVVSRADGPTREQYLVLVDEWVPDAPAPADPLRELFVRFIEGHGPAGAADFAWWSGLPLRVARQAVAASHGRVDEVADGLYVAAETPRRAAAAPDVVALAPFDEYYISYADRSHVCPPELLPVVGPGKNGLVRPILLARGVVAGAWSHSKAVGRHADDPVPELAIRDAATDAEVASALARYARFIAG